MHLSLWFASLWPGFAQACVLGRWGGLILATAAGAALNFAVVATLVWPQWPMPGVPTAANAAAAWLVVLGFWIVGFVQLRSDLPLLKASLEPTKHDPQQQGDFCETQHLYLRGHWIEAETSLTRLLAKYPQDIEARLLLASVQRRTRRWADAKRTLADLRQRGAASRWWLEIEAELKRIEEHEQEAAGAPQQLNEDESHRANAA
jgi:Tetratricopeptide repeat